MFLRDVAFALPDHNISSEEIANSTGHDLNFIENKIGVKERRVLGIQETQIDLAKKACHELFIRNTELSADMVQLLIVVTQNPDNKLPHSSASLQKILELPKNTACFDISLGCSGYVYGLSVIKALMQSEGFSNAILVTCDPYSKIISKKDRDTFPLFGDAASASWLSGEKGGVIGSADFGTDGSGAHHLQVLAGGSAYPISDFYRELSIADSKDYRLKMNGNAIFKFVLDEIPQSIDRCIDKNDIKKEDIDYYIFHQASKFLLSTLTEKMGIDKDRVPTNLERYGNTVSTSIPLLVSELLDSGALKGKVILISGFGVGLSWASNIIKF